MLLALLLWWLLTPSPAEAAKTGRIVGRVVNGSAQRPQQGVKVTLSRASADGKQTTKSVVTDGRGRYAFDDLATGTQYVYAIDADFDGGLFAGSALQLPDDTEKTPVVRSTLRVWETTTAPQVIQLARDDIFISQRDESLGVLESVTIANTSREAYIGRGREGGGNKFTPSVAFALPRTVVTDENGSPDIQLIASDIDLPILLPSEFGVAANAAIPPGTNKMTFSYLVSGSGGSFDLTRNALYPILDFSVYATDPLDVRSNRLVDNGAVTVGGKEYARFSSPEPLEAGDPVQILAVAEAGVPAWLVAVPIAVAVLVVALLLLGFLRRKKRPRSAAPVVQRKDESHDGAPDRADLLVAIAQLDVDYEKGALAEDTWREERSRLKSELDASSSEKVTR